MSDWIASQQLGDWFLMHTNVFNKNNLINNLTRISGFAISSLVRSSYCICRRPFSSHQIYGRRRLQLTCWRISISLGKRVGLAWWGASLAWSSLTQYRKCWHKKRRNMSPTKWISHIPENFSRPLFCSARRPNVTISILMKKSCSWLCPACVLVKDRK